MVVWFGVLAYFWVRQELINAKTHSPNRLLVAGGAWSYSLYLVHPQSASRYERFHFANLGDLPEWFLAMTLSLLFAFCLYLLVERRSHRFARKFKVRTISATPELKVSRCWHGSELVKQSLPA
jgi:peptidoglycan/LPS O-acetylase OafA/YrhL